MTSPKKKEIFPKRKRREIKERKETAVFYQNTTFRRTVAQVQSYCPRSDVMMAFTPLAYQNQT